MKVRGRERCMLARWIGRALLMPRGPWAPAGVAIAGAVWCAGCMVGPDYQRPGAAVNDAWEAPTGGEASSGGRWWESFDDPALSALVESAYAQNLTLRAAGLRVLEARAARGIEPLA